MNFKLQPLYHAAVTLNEQKRKKIQSSPIRVCKLQSFKSQPFRYVTVSVSEQNRTKYKAY